MAEFRLTEQAEDDFDGIGEYTQDRWGEDQAIQYLIGLDEMFKSLAQGSKLGRPCDDLREGLLSCVCNRHVIFFRRSASGDVEILRILHERMDFERHI